MTLGAPPRTARALARVLAPLALVVVLVALLGLAPAGAQEDPPVTEPPTTEPPVTEPPTTEPPTTEPPVTEPPSTTPPVTPPATTTPTASPAPTSPSPATTNQPASSPTPAPTTRRGTPTTRATTAAGQPPASDDPAPGEEPATDGAEVEAVGPTSGGDRTPLPMLVAPTTTPGSPAIAVVEAAPVASSKVLPLALIVGVGLAVLALVLRPARGPRGAAAVVESANPLLLAGPLLAAPATATRSASPPPPPPIAPDLAGTETQTATATQTTVGTPATGPADDDLPDVVSLVEQARIGRGSGPAGPS